MSISYLFSISEAVIFMDFPLPYENPLLAPLVTIFFSIFADY